MAKRTSLKARNISTTDGNPLISSWAQGFDKYCNDHDIDSVELMAALMPEEKHAKDDPPQDPHSISKGMAAAALAAGVQVPANIPMTMAGLRTNPADRKVLHELENVIRAAGVKRLPSMAADPALGPNGAQQRNALKELPAIRRMLDSSSQAYNTSSKTIYSRGRDPGLLAHEFGHHLQFTSSPRLAHATRRPVPLAALLGLGLVVTKNEDTGRNVALGSTAALTPLLALEVDASRRGAQQLAKLRTPTSALKRLSPYLGVSTYAAATLTPLAIHYLKKYFGGYRPKPKDKDKGLSGYFQQTKRRAKDNVDRLRRAIADAV